MFVVRVVAADNGVLPSGTWSQAKTNIQLESLHCRRTGAHIRWYVVSLWRSLWQWRSQGSRESGGRTVYGTKISTSRATIRCRSVIANTSIRAYMVGQKVHSPHSKATSVILLIIDRNNLQSVVIVLKPYSFAHVRDRLSAINLIYWASGDSDIRASGAESRPTSWILCSNVASNFARRGYKSLYRPTPLGTPVEEVCQ